MTRIANLTGEQYVQQIGWPHRDPNHDGVLHVMCPWCRSQQGVKGDAYISKLSGKGACRRANNCGRKWNFREFREKTGDRTLPSYHFKPAVQREYKKPEPYKPAAEDLEARALRGLKHFFSERGLDLGVVDSLGIRPAVYHGKPAICYPLKHGPGSDFPEINRRYRVYSDAEEKGWNRGWKNFRWESGCQVGLLGRDTVEDTEGPLVLVEGQDDLVAVRQLGFGNSVSIPNAIRRPENATERDLPSDLQWLRDEMDFLSGFKIIYLLLDSDDAGDYTAEVIARTLKPGQCWRARLGEGLKDACDAVQAGWTHDKLRAVLNQGSAESYAPPKLRNLREFIDSALDHRESPQATGDKLCLPRMNEMLGGGARGGEMTYILADDGTGKSTLVTNLVVGFASQGVSSCIFSGEDSPIFVTDWISDMLIRPNEQWSRELARERLLQIAPFIWFVAHVGTIPVSTLLECYAHAAGELGIRQFFTDSLMMVQTDESDYKAEARALLRIKSELVMPHDVHHWLVWHPRKGATDDTTGRDKASGAGLKQISSLHHNGFNLYAEVNDDEGTVRTFLKHVKGRKFGRQAGVVELVFDKARRTYREAPVQPKQTKKRSHASTWHDRTD